jgi:hypothetical protein
MSFELTITVFGPGTNPQARSHWGFLIYRSGQEIGDLLHTRLLDNDRLWFQFEERSGVDLVSNQTQGRVRLAMLSDEQRPAAKKIIATEPPPRDGVKRCQDWVFDTMISLEAEEIVESGNIRVCQRPCGKAGQGCCRVSRGQVDSGEVDRWSNYWPEICNISVEFSGLVKYINT